MSIWGKIIGGAAGFAIGGPLGALIGTIAGHAVDELRPELLNDEPPPFDPNNPSAAGAPSRDQPDMTRSIAFTAGVIVLGAKLAKADGIVHRVEVDAFKRVFRVPAEELGNVGRLFDIAKRDSAGFEPYARQLAKMFVDRRVVLEELLGGLFHIAAADHVLHREELRLLEQVADIFGMSKEDFHRIRSLYGAGQSNNSVEKADPWAVLGVDKSADLETVKAAYRRLMREHHPDRLIAQGVPQEFINLAQEKTATINAAYEQIERHLRPPA